MPAAARTPALGYIRVSRYLGRDRGEALTEDVRLGKREAERDRADRVGAQGFGSVSPGTRRTESDGCPRVP